MMFLYRCVIFPVLFFSKKQGSKDLLILLLRALTFCGVFSTFVLLSLVHSEWIIHSRLVLFLSFALCTLSSFSQTMNVLSCFGSELKIF